MPAMEAKISNSTLTTNLCFVIFPMALRPGLEIPPVLLLALEIPFIQVLLSRRIENLVQFFESLLIFDALQPIVSVSIFFPPFSCIISFLILMTLIYSFNCHNFIEYFYFNDKNVTNLDISMS